MTDCLEDSAVDEEDEIDRTADKRNDAVSICSCQSVLTRWVLHRSRRKDAGRREW